MHKEKKVVEKKEYSLAERLADAAEEEERMAAYSVQVRLQVFADSFNISANRLKKIEKTVNAIEMKKNETTTWS